MNIKSFTHLKFIRSIWNGKYYDPKKKLFKLIVYVKNFGTQVLSSFFFKYENFKTDYLIR